MAFALDDDTVPPVVVAPQAPNGRNAARPLSLHVDAEPTGPDPEVEIGHILVQAQQFADKTVEEAEHVAQTVTQAARAHAASIVERARQQVIDVAAQSPPPISPEVVKVLSAALDEFTAANRILAAELEQLRKTLTVSEPTPSAPRPAQSTAPRPLSR